MTSFRNFLCFILILCLTTVPTIVFANNNVRSPLVKEIYTLYKDGDYEQVVKKIDELIELVGEWGMAYYLKGRAYFLMSKYDKASEAFAKAYKANVFPRSMFYEYAQSLYGVNELKNARIFFKKAIDEGFSPDKALYYYAYCSQLLADYPEAEKNYKLLINATNADPGLKQASQFMLAKVYLEQSKEKGLAKEEFVQKVVIPELQKAKELDEKSAMAKDIVSEIQKVKKDNNLLYKDGRTVSESSLYFKFEQETSYDSNVTQESDDTASSVGTDKTSIVSNTDFELGYKFDIARLLVTTVEIAGSYSKYLNDDVDSVRMNNQYYYEPSIKNSVKHKINGKAASANLDFVYNGTSKAFQGDYKSLEAYSTHWSVSLGEQFSFFAAGDTMFSLKYKDFQGVDGSTTDSRSVALTTLQYFFLSEGRIYLLMFYLDDTKTKPIELSSTRSYLIKNSYIGGEIFSGFTWNGGVGINIIDTLEQKSTRGTEIMFMPDISLVRPNLFGKSFKSDLELKYELVKKSSDLDSYNYTDHILSLSFSINL